MSSSKANEFAGESYRDYLLKRLSQDPQEAVEYLNAALDEGPGAFLLAVKDVIDAGVGMSSLSDSTKLHRVSLYKMLSERGNPTLRSLESVLDSIGLKLRIAQKDSESASPSA